MLEKELMHDLHEKREIRKNVADRQKDIDKSKDDTKDDLEVYMAAKDMISRYRLAYRLNLVEPGQAWKIHADQILRSDVSNKLVDHRKLYRKYLRMYPAAAKRANIVLSNFDSLKKEIDNDITKLKKLIDSKRFYRVWNIWPNLDRIASRINTAEEKVRIKAEKEISQQNTSSLVEESAKEMATKQTQKWREKVAPKMYMKRDWDRFIFTKESNPVKIHEIMSAFIKEKPEAVFLLDYNWCIGNDSLKADIKRRTKNNSWKVYIKYNQKIKTYDFFDWTTKEPLWGKRPYIWEWVTMISKEVEWLVAQKQQQDRLDASTNINYAKLAAGNLEKNFEGQIKILQDIKLTRSSSFWDEIKSGEWYWTETHPTRAKDFLVCVETRLNDVVNKWRARAYLDNKNPIDTGWWILQVRLITSSGDLTKVPLFVKDANRGAARWWLPDYLYEYISHRKSQTQEYLTRRLNEIWWERKHMERRDSDVGYEKQSLSTDEKLREKQKKDIEKNKDLKKYWIDSLLGMLAQLEKDKHTPPEIWPLLAHVEGIKKSLENSPKNSLPSKATWDAAIKETQRLYIVYKNNDGRFATITDATAKKLIEQIFNAKSRVEVQNARSELWNWMTFFDNSSRSWAVSDYADDMMESNQSYYKNWWKDGKGLLEIVDEDNKWYNDCYQNICRLTYIDVDEKTGEITGPQENKKFIDDLMACDDRISLGTLLKSKNLIPKNLEKEDSNKYYEICTTILKTIENKREMENKFELTADDMKKSYMAEINELQKKTSLTDEEMARMALLMCIIEDDEGLKESAKGQTQIGKDTIRYWWIDSLLDEHITPYLAKKWGWFKWGNEAMTRNYNDSKWLRWWWDRTDENCEKIWPVLKEILTEVVITAVAIWLWAVTWWLWTAAVAWLRTLAGGARIASIWNKVKNFTRIAKLCEKMWKWAKYCKKLKSTAKAKIWWKVGDTRFWRAYSRAQTLSRTKVVWENAAKNVWRGLAGLSENTKAWRAIAQCAEWAGWTKLFKAGKTIWEVVKLWNIARKEWSLWMKAVWMIFEWTWFHVVSTALHNALEGRDILADLDPRYNFRWYVQSIAFLWVLKFLWKPINTMTNTTMQFVMWQRISTTQFGNALKYVAWLWWEFWTLCATDQALSVGFGEGFKEMTLKDAIHSIGIILWLRLHWRIKQLRSITIKEYNRERWELKVDFWEWVVTLNEDEILLDNNWERGENNISKDKMQKSEQELKGIEDVENHFDELLSQANKGNYENVKLDRVTKAMFEGSVYFEWLSRLFKKNRTLPTKFVKKIRDNLVEMKNKCRNSLTEAKKKLVERWNNFFEKKLAENWNEIEIMEDEINLIENESRVNEWNRGVEEKSLTEKQILAESMGSDLHEGWRRWRLKEDGTYEPRIIETKDAERIRKYWTNQVDIANTKFEDLPLDRKYENLEAAKVAVDLVYDKISKWEDISPKLLEEMSAKVHEERLKRNPRAKWSELDKLYYELPESEKLKDRDHILQAIEKIWWREKRFEIEWEFKERQKIEEQQRRVKEEQEGKKEEITDNDNPGNIADKLEKSMDNGTDFEVSKEAFVSWRFIEWIKNWFNKNIQRPDFSLPRNSINRLKNKISEMMKNRGNELSDGYKKLMERFGKYLNDLLKQPGERIEIKKQQKERRRVREEQQRRVREGQQRRAREEQQRRAREEQSRILNQNKRPDRWINTERREMSEVQRISDVVAIWDLHWEYEALKWNMEYAWLAREINWHLERTWWNKKVVFQWDILADRWTDWLRIIQEIHKLREQARQQWWDIDIIVGNHDDFMISYLTWRNWIHWKWLDIASYGQQWKWLTELAKFIWRKVWDFDSLYWTGIRQEIFQAMRNNSEWRLILEEICNMKLVSQVDDVLYIHTNPTAKMLESLTRWNVQSNINSINQKYQWYLRNALLWEWNWSISLEEFNNISDIFLDTNNRPKYGSEVWLDNYCTILNNQGINMILHWHSWWAGRTIERSWIKIVDIDYWYWKRWQINGKEHSVSVIKKEWWVNYMWDNVANANLEHPIWSEVYVDFGNPKMQKGKVNSYNPKTKEYTVVLDWDTDIWIVLKAENLRNVWKNEYFWKKSHKFNVTEWQARENSRRSDEVTRETDESKKYQKRQELANEIARQYKEATWKDLELTDSQVKAILEAHNMEWNLWELERGQVRARNTKLKEAGIRKNVRRFLMEAGFCGKINLHESMNGLWNGINWITENIKNMNQQLQWTKVQLTEIKNLFDKINSTTTVNPEDIQNVVQKIRNLEDNIWTKFENLDQIISRETNWIPDILRQLYNNWELIKDQSWLQITESVWKSLETQWNELKILNETVGEIYYNLHNYEYIADRILGKSWNFNEGIKLKKNIAYLRGFLERFNYLSGSINHSRSWIESFWNESYKQANNYFDWKSHRFNVTEIQARWNSKMMDNLLNEINREWFSQEEISSKLEELRKKISEQYEQATWEKLELTDEQLLSVLDAHEQDWKLWELSLWQLRVKVKLLAETIKNDKVRRFLLEAGFCGQEWINDNYTSDINELAKKLNLKQYEIENIEKSIELINKTPIQNGIRLGELPITEILNNNYEWIKDLVKFIPGPYQVLIFFRDYLALPNQKLGQLEYERNKKLQEILSNFSEDIKNKCKNAWIDIDEKLRILKWEISLEEAKQICTDEKIIKLAQNKEWIINKHALELAMELSNWKIHTNEIWLIFELGNNEYTKIKELIKHLEKELSNANLSINNVWEIIQVWENHWKYRFEYLLKIYLIDWRRLTNHYKMGDIKHNLAISLMTNSLWDHYREYKGERRENLTNLIYQSAYAYMSKEEKQALWDYKKTWKWINKTANDPNNETSKIISQYLERMPLKEDIEVERKDPKFWIAGKIKLSMNGETKTLSEILDTGEKCDETNLEQSSFIRDSFISTTVHNYQTAPIVWHFTVKKWVWATYLDVLWFNSEWEVLLDKNCKITITKLDASGGGAHIYATVEKI